MSIDINNLRWDRNDGRMSPGRRKRRRPYLRGPIPLAWIQAAAQLPGCALQVGIALWYRVGLQRGGRAIDLNLSRLTQFGADRHSAARGLRNLEDARLVAVERRPGAKPLVTILDAPHA